MFTPDDVAPAPLKCLSQEAFAKEVTGKLQRFGASRIAGAAAVSCCVGGWVCPGGLLGSLTWIVRARFSLSGDVSDDLDIVQEALRMFTVTGSALWKPG